VYESRCEVQERACTFFKMSGSYGTGPAMLRQSHSAVYLDRPESARHYCERFFRDRLERILVEIKVRRY